VPMLASLAGAARTRITALCRRILLMLRHTISWSPRRSAVAGPTALFFETLDAGAANRKFRSWWIYPLILITQTASYPLNNLSAALPGQYSGITLRSAIEAPLITREVLLETYFLLVIMAADAQTGPFLQFQASCLCGTL
jgi:hypothetical protein